MLQERENFVYGRDLSFGYQHAGSAHFSELIEGWKKKRLITSYVGSFVLRISQNKKED